MADVIKLENGKYTVVNALSEGGGFHALRYGEEWRDLAGDDLVYAMFCEIARLRWENERLMDKGYKPANRITQEYLDAQGGFL